MIGAGGGVATAGGSGGVTGSDRLGGTSFDPERVDHVAIPARAITTSATPATRWRDQIDAGIASRSWRIALTMPVQRSQSATCCSTALTSRENRVPST